MNTAMLSWHGVKSKKVQTFPRHQTQTTNIDKEATSQRTEPGAAVTDAADVLLAQCFSWIDLVWALAGKQEAGTTLSAEFWQCLFKTTVLGGDWRASLLSTGSLTLKVRYSRLVLWFVNFAYLACWHLPPQAASKSAARTGLELPQIWI